MPVVASSAYNIAEDVLIRVRTILNDSEIQGGDIITDTAPFSFDLINAGYERVQIKLATYGVETYTNDVWFIGLPTIGTIDPESRLIIDDTGTNIITPTGSGNVFSNLPQLPTDLIVPLKLWERQTGTTDQASPMNQPARGLISTSQGNFLVDWEWKNDQLRFRGATQSQDVKMLYEKHLPKLAAPTDPVPIRGVVNAAAYYAATIFAESRGGLNAPKAEQHAAEEIFDLQQVSTRRRQRIQRRRRPYSGRGGRSRFNC